MPRYLHLYLHHNSIPIRVLEEFIANNKDEVYNFIRLGVRPEITFRYVTMHSANLPDYLYDQLSVEERNRILSGSETKDDIQRVVLLTANLSILEFLAEMINVHSVLVAANNEMFDLFDLDWFRHSPGQAEINLIN